MKDLWQENRSNRFFADIVGQTLRKFQGIVFVLT
jgi:hypothetical protein